MVNIETFFKKTLHCKKHKIIFVADILSSNNFRPTNGNLWNFPDFRMA